MQRILVRVGLGAALVLLIPLVLTLLARWHGKPGALVLAFVLVCGGAYLVHELMTATGRNTAYRCAAGVALATVFLLVWMNAALDGILGDDPANMMYFGVLLVGLVGACVARLEPGGMSCALLATAFAMVLVPAIALVIGTPALANGLPAVFGLHAGFALLFVASAWLFRRAGVVRVD